MTATDPLTREFHGPTRTETVIDDRDDHGVLLLAHTTADDPLSLLRAG
ncbi:hypothetical protein [Nocardia sp. NPDC049526]